jgi:H+/Cl- antiporter ClcA
MNQFKTRGYGHASIWVGSAAVGIAAILYARMVNVAQAYYLKMFHQHALIISSLAPLFFLAATGLVRRFAPDAKGSGIPQVLEAIEMTEKPATAQSAWSTDLVSMKTAGVKVLSSLVGFLGGASIGREGPTVQIAASSFAWIAKITKKKVPHISLHGYLVAGAAAGVAAAFNTPLAGITFAIEEIAENAFGAFRQMVMLSVIIAGITAQAILGNYLYFGHPSAEAVTPILLPQALLIGLIAGCAGGAFSKLLSNPAITKLPEKWWPRALACGVICGAIGYYTNGASAGTGYEITQTTLSRSNMDEVNVFFPVLKLITTVLSYLSGMAGGIFSPCVSIGASIGVTVAKLAHFANFKACTLMGMVAFFAGAVQAPLTAVIIVMEMTDEHILILPFMISAFVGHGIAKTFMKEPLYRVLAKKNMEKNAAK